MKVIKQLGKCYVHIIFNFPSFNYKLVNVNNVGIGLFNYLDRESKFYSLINFIFNITVLFIRFKA